MICPFCKEEGKKSHVHPGVRSTTLIGFSTYYDEDGIYHIHDPNSSSQNFICSNKHRWNEVSYEPCPNCEYKKGETVITPRSPDKTITL